MPDSSQTSSHVLQQKVDRLELEIDRHETVEESLRAGEEKYRSLMDNLPGTVARIDIEGKFLFVNKRYLELTGLSEEQILGRSAEVLAPYIEPESFPKMVEGVSQAMLEQKRVETEIRGIDVRGARLSLLQIAHPWYTTSGDLGGVEILTQDITARKRAEEELRRYQGVLEAMVKQRTAELEKANAALLGEIAERERTGQELLQEEERYRLLFNTTSDPVLVFCFDTNGQPGKFLEVNHTAQQALGYSREELLEMTPYDITAPENLAPLAKVIDDTVSADSFEGERLWVGKYGKRILCEVRAHRFNLNNSSAVIVVAHDITQRKRVEEALRESEEKFRNLAEKSPNMIFINKAGRIVYANEKSLEFLGYTREDLYAPDFDFMKLIAPEHRELVTHNFGRHMGGHDIEPYEYALVAKNGRRINAFTTTKLIAFEGGWAILGIVTDITEERRLERRLAEVEVRQRMQLGHDLHDGLGQCLTGVSLRCKALEQEIASGAPVKKKDLAEIGRLVTLSVQQAHDLSEGLSPSALNQGELGAALRGLAAQTRKILGVKCSVICPSAVRLDDEIVSTHLYRIAQEAITNAVRHGKADTITISLRRTKAAFAMRVDDNGKGIGRRAARGEGMGMRIMHYRARVIAGVLEIGRRPRRGSFVKCTLRAP